MHRDPQALGIYVHFPFCLHKCRYCDFFSIGTDQIGYGRDLPEHELQSYVLGIREEFTARTQATTFGTFRKLNTIYFGGGTASMLPASLIAELLALFAERFTINADCEITLEGNPENFTPDYLDELHAIGITRVNAGIQTFSEQQLQRVGRLYDRARYERIVADLSQSRFEHIGVDLMYGFPEQTEQDFRYDLERVLSGRFDHLSLYSLTAEPGTPFAADVTAGKERGPQTDVQELIFGELPDLMSARGFSIYEVSNYARPGAMCRHNLRYWLYEPYLALGPGAHGFDGHQRYANARHVARWRADPTGAPFEEHQPASDIALNLLRIACPVSEHLVTEVLQENGLGAALPLATALLEGWVRDGLAVWSPAVHARGESGAPNNAWTGTAGQVASARPAQRFFQWTTEGLLSLDRQVLRLAEILGDPVAQGVGESRST